MLKDETAVAGFSDLVAVSEPSIRRALTAAYGSEIGLEAASEAFAYGWQHWERVGIMQNPAGYLFRVGMGKARRLSQRRRPVAQIVYPSPEPWVEPGLGPALEKLSERQRIVVSLIHAFDWSFGEVADFLGVSKASVQSYEARAMRTLQRELGVKA